MAMNILGTLGTPNFILLILLNNHHFCSDLSESPYLIRAYPNNRVVMRPSEKFEAKAAGQKCSPEVVYSTLRTFLADNAGIGLCSRPQ
jgi:hypothetical protein